MQIVNLTANEANAHVTIMAAHSQKASMKDEDLKALVIRLTCAQEGVRGNLLPVLHTLQNEIGCVPDEAVPFLAQALNLSRADIHGVITFYHDFRRRPAAKHVVKLCRSEACQARGGSVIEAAAVDRLGVEMGKMREDGQVTLEAVYCLGLCATGPNALVNGRPISRIDVARLDRIAAEIAA